MSLVYQPENDEIYADMVSSGMKKIAWAAKHMPVLQSIKDTSFVEQQPFEGMTIAMSIHLEAKTANLALALQQGGADVHVAGSNVLSTQDDIALALSSLGVTVNAIHGSDLETYVSHLKTTLSCHPHIIIDDGGDLIDLIAEECAEYGDRLIGGCEETTTGIRRLLAREVDGTLPCPMFAVNDAKAKHYYDNKYGTGQSVLTAVMQSTNLVVAGKVVVVAGYGWCGQGIALRAAGMGADVVVTEVDPFKALDALMHGFRVMTMKEAARIGDIFITATGCIDVITIDHMKFMKDGAILANAGHFDCEVSVEDLKEYSIKPSSEVRSNVQQYTILSDKDVPVTLYLLAEGRLVNLAAGDGHPVEIMDMSFSIQALTAEVFQRVYNGGQKQLAKAVYVVPADIDDLVGTTKLCMLGIEIDSLTYEQEEYMSSYTGS